MPLVSVIIPAFNAEDTLGEALASVCGQTFLDLEVIVVDDGSTDGTVRVAERYADRLDLTVVSQRNTGASEARNAGIRRARGRYCALLDADDIMLPELIAAQVAMFQEDPELGLVFTDVSTFDERGTLHDCRWNLARIDAGGPVLDRLLEDNFVTTSAVMAPRACLLEAGLFNVQRDVAEDYELWLTLASRWKVGMVARPLVLYRYRRGSLSQDKLHSTRCALDVVQHFWRCHPMYRRRKASVYHRSLARHLRQAGAAAYCGDRRRVALGYLLQSLRHDPLATTTWKWLAKDLLPRDRFERAPHDAPEIA